MRQPTTNRKAKPDGQAQFRSITPEKITDNPFQSIENDWFLLTAGTIDSFNTMTCGWGAWGVLWKRPVVFAFVRPTRHTYGFANASDLFTVSFYDKRHRKALEFCGTHSGRDCDKAAEAGLTPAETERGAVYFREARLVLECRKIYDQDLDPARFLDNGIEANYPQKDYHRMYVGEVVNVMARKRTSN